MAAYFPTLRRQSRLNVVQEETRQSQPEPTTSSSRAEDDRSWPGNTSILIFPSPSTSLPPTPASTNAPIPASPASGSMSNFSLPTSISIESNLESASERSAPKYIRLRRADPQTSRGASSRSPISPGVQEVRDRWRSVYSGKFEVDLESASEATGTGDREGDPEVEIWEWSSMQASSNEAFPVRQDDESLHRSGIELWASHLRTRTTSQWTQATDSTNATRLTHFSHSTPEKGRIITQPAVHFPFLSAILKLLRIDPETVLLLGVFGQPTNVEADLFLSSPFDHTDSNHRNNEEGEERRNPVVALLRQSDSSVTTRSLKEGLQASAEYHNQQEGIMLTLPPELPFGIQDVVWAPITLSKAVASGTLGLTAGALSYSSSAVGSAFNAVGGGIWRRQPVTA